MDYKIIFCDIDGTLVDDKKNLSEENIYWIKKVVKDFGVKFVLSTGRMFPAVEYFYRDLGLKGPVCTFNGGALYDEDFNLIIDHKLDRDLTKRIVKGARKLDIHNMIIYDSDKWVIESKDLDIYTWEMPILKVEPCVMNWEDFAENHLSEKVLVIDKDEELVKRFKSCLVSMGISDDGTGDYWVDYYYAGGFLEIMPHGITKETGIREIAKWCNVDMSQVIAIGDQFNDVDMIAAAGLGVAMKNGCDDAKKVAKLISPKTNNESGVASVIKKVFYGIEC